MATQTATFHKIALDFQPPVARLTLANGPLNIIDMAMMDELRAALQQVESRSLQRGVANRAEIGGQKAARFAILHVG